MKNGSLNAINLALLSIIIFLLEITGRSVLIYPIACLMYLLTIFNYVRGRSSKQSIVSLTMVFACVFAMHTLTQGISCPYIWNTDSSTDYESIKVIDNTHHVFIGQGACSARYHSSFNPLPGIFVYIIYSVSKIPLMYIPTTWSLVHGIIIMVVLYLLYSNLFKNIKDIITSLIIASTCFTINDYLSYFTRESFAYAIFVISLLLTIKNTRSICKQCLILMVLLIITITVSHTFVALILLMLLLMHTFFSKNDSPSVVTFRYSVILIIVISIIVWMLYVAYTYYINQMLDIMHSFSYAIKNLFITSEYVKQIPSKTILIKNPLERIVTVMYYLVTLLSVMLLNITKKINTIEMPNGVLSNRETIVVIKNIALIMVSMVVALRAFGTISSLAYTISIRILSYTFIYIAPCIVAFINVLSRRIPKLSAVVVYVVVLILCIGSIAQMYPPLKYANLETPDDEYVRILSSFIAMFRSKDAILMNDPFGVYTAKTWIIESIACIRGTYEYIPIAKKSIISMHDIAIITKLIAKYYDIEISHIYIPLFSNSPMHEYINEMNVTVIFNCGNVMLTIAT